MIQAPGQDDAVPRHAALARSGHVARRFALRLAILTLVAAGTALAGGSFARSLAGLTMMSGLVCGLLATALRERVGSPFLTLYDEGLWFMLIANAAHRLAEI